MRNLGIRYISIIAFAVFVSRCGNTKILDQKVDFPDQKWYLDSTCTFSATIDDTSSAYNIDYTVRNTLNFGSYNLFVKIILTDPGNTVVRSDLQELTLMDPNTGYPFGSGMGDIYDHQITAYSKLKFKQKGTYQIRLIHYMRSDPVTELVSLGLRISPDSGKE